MHHRFYRNYQQVERVYRYYIKFIDKLNRSGMTVKLNEGPVARKQQAVIQVPEQQQIIQDIIDGYIQIRYAIDSEPLLVKKPISQIKQFK